MVQDRTADHEPRDQERDRLRESGDDTESQHGHTVLRDLFFQNGHMESLADGAVMKIRPSANRASEQKSDDGNPEQQEINEVGYDRQEDITGGKLEDTTVWLVRAGMLRIGFLLERIDQNVEQHIAEHLVE